jgi:transcriptional regulator with XRE-family HTH domain
MSLTPHWTGGRTRLLRDAYPLSVRDFADLVGVAPSTISALEKGGPRRLRPSTQRLFDTALDKAPAAVRVRFDEAVSRLGSDGRAVSADDASGIVGEDGLLDQPWQIEERRSWLAAIHMDEMKLAYLESATERAIAENESTPPVELAPRARSLHLHVDALLRSGQHPRQRGRLYGVAAHLSGLLAALALDLNQFVAARAYGQEAFDLAAAAEQSELQAWARATQSLVEYYAGHYHDAVAFARDGQHIGQGGRHTVRLALNGEARALARIGDRSGVDEAVERGLAALDRYPAAGGVSPSLSLDVYCRTRATANAATAYLSIGASQKALSHGSEALVAFDAAGLHGPQALTRLDLAAALLINEDADPDRACALAAEALDVAGCEQFESVRQRAREFVATASRWDTPALRDLADRVGAQQAPSSS